MATMSIQPDSFGSGSGPAISGSNDLQSVLDQNTAAVQALTTAINNADNNGTGTTTSTITSAQAGGATITTGSLNTMATNIGGGTGSNNGSGFLSSISNAFGGGSGSGGSGSSLASSSSGGSLGNFSITGTGSILGAAANVASTLINTSGALGVSMGQDIIQQNTYGYISGNAGYSNGAGGTISAQQAQTGAFGSAASGQLNRLATGTADAASGAAILTQMADSPNFASNISGAAAPTQGYGTTPWTMAAGVGMANPGLGETGSADVANALISPISSYNLQMMGVSTQPIGIGGQVNSLSSVYGSIASRMMGQQLSSNGTMNQQQLTTNLNDPLMAYQMMQATGMTSSEYQEWANSWEQENQAATSKNISLGTVQNDISQFMSGQMSASKLQAATGINGSAWESSVQSQSATQMGAENDNNQAFVAGLQNATTALNALTVVMSSFLKSSGGSAVAGASSAAGISIASNSILSNIIGQTGTEGAALAGGAGVAISNSSFGQALSSAISSAVSAFDTTTSGGSSSSSSSGGTQSVTANGTNSTKIVAGGKTFNVKNLGKTFSLQQMFSALKSAGLNKYAAAGIAGVLMNESSGNPTAIGDSGGAIGLAQWHPMYHPEVTPEMFGSNATVDFNDQIKVIASEAVKLGINKATSVSDAMAAWTTGYEQPANDTPDETAYLQQANALISAAQGGTILVGERGPELLSFANGGTANVTPADQAASLLRGTSAMSAQAPWTAANRLLSGTFTGNSSQGSGITINFDKGAVQLGTNYQGVFTSQDAQSAANQFTQALEKALSKSTVLNSIASGVTG